MDIKFTTEALQRIGELYAIEADVRGCSAEQRLAARKVRAAPMAGGKSKATSLRGVAADRKNWLFAGSDSGGEYAAVLYLADRHMPSEQCGTRKMAALRH